MFRRISIFSIAMLWSVLLFSQTGVSLKFGTSPWHLVHQFKDLSSPISLSYSGGLNVEHVLFNSVGIATGIDYAYAKPGTKYVDLSDQQNLMAVLFEEQINQRYIEVVHHEISVPFLFVFYHNGFRTGIGASYHKYLFDNNLSGDKYERLSDYGLNFCTGARLSKRIILSMGYYYGLNKMLDLNAVSESGAETANLSGNMQQLQVHLAISLFNNFNDAKFFLSD